ncbi:MAG: pyruvate dehydrogenase (acetyl-transferring), homodimeric type, partial [Methylococcaceae bacterium]|nr:pyruvate dehydrogenase (acetyl-transferring), homodimeric type [Methylococcaceae bacterium]
WGSYWDPLLARDTKGLLRKRMEEAVDGEYQNYKARDGAYVREHFFGKYPELLALVANLSDDDVWRLNRGGHDPHKVYAAYKAAVEHTGQPTVILAKTVKGYGMGSAGEGLNTTHSQKKMALAEIRAFRDRFRIPIPDDQLEELPFYKPAEDSPEMKYIRERREALGGYLPSRRQDAPPLQVPGLEIFDTLTKDSGDHAISTTMVYVRILNTLLRDQNIGKMIVPIIADEARTFGMEGLFRQYGIYSSVGQLYEPVDAGQISFYREDRQGQILEEGITEAGALSSWMAAGTSYSNHGAQMIPFYIFYSMFGFQRVGDLIWAAGDMQARGFLIGGTSGRTTLAGEGLQHQDGHSLLLAATVPSCVCYDPAFGYELAVIIQDGLRRMVQEGERIFYYITVTNENYLQPELPPKSVEGILKGMHRIRKSRAKADVQLLGSGAILREVIEAAELLKTDFKLNADIWSVTSFNELRRDGERKARWNLLHPEHKAKLSYVEQCLGDSTGPVIAACDYQRLVADQIRAFVPRRYTVLGTDGYGRSDCRRELRKYFEVDRFYIALAALKSLAEDGLVSIAKVSQAISLYKIDPEKPDPLSV